MRDRAVGAIAARLGSALCAALFVSACFGASSQLDVRLAPAQNPETGTEVVVARVTDRRVFQNRAWDSRRASAKGGIPAPEQAVRILARRHVGSRDQGNLVATDDRTVEDLAREALARGLREAGYRVLEPGAPGADAAIPVEADIDRFWGRMITKWSRLRFEFRSVLQVRGPLPGIREGATLCGNYLLSRGGASQSAYVSVVEKGLETLSGNFRDVLQRAGGGSEGPPIGPMRCWGDG